MPTDPAIRAPVSVAFDRLHRMYVADGTANRIFRVPAGPGVEPVR